MLPAPNPRDDAAACDFLAQLAADRAAGRERALADYLSRFPGFEARITHEHAREHVVPSDEAPGPARRIGRYDVLRELGRGGQAIVYLAEDPALRRTVALKVLSVGPGWLSDARRERLRREAQALARLDHPGICTILEASLDDDAPFLAMRYIDGESLAARLTRARERPDPASDALLAALPGDSARIDRVLELAESAARALHEAHEAGVVHRDVKPANVMLDGDDEPVLLDFGLARTDDQDQATLTRSGEVFGSVAYMAPEQLEGRRDVDRRCDVYALGVTLYECLTLARPYDGETSDAILRQASTGQRRDPVKLNHAVSRELATVLDQALEPDRARRYGTALAFADDLRRLRERRDVTARPTSRALLLRRWCRRHPVAAVALAILSGALAIATTLLVQLAIQHRSLVAWQQAVDALALRDHPIEALSRVLDAAERAPLRKVNQPLLEILAACPDALLLSAERLGAAPVPEPAFIAGGTQVVMLTEAGELVVVDATSGAIVRRVRAHEPSPRRPERGWRQPALMQASPDGRELLTSSNDGTVRRWSTVTWTELPMPEEITHGNRGLRDPLVPAFAPDGRRAALAGDGNTLLVVDLGPAPRARRCAGFAGWLHDVAFQPGGDLLVAIAHSAEHEVAIGGHDVRVFDAATGRELAHLDLGGQEAHHVAWDDAGRRFAIVGFDGTIRIFDAATRTCAIELHAGGEDANHVHWASFASDGRELVTLGFEGLTVWDLARAQRRARVPAASARPFFIGAWSPDRSRLAAVLKDGTIRVYDAARWVEIDAARWESRFPQHVAWNTAGDRLAFIDPSGVHIACVGSRPHAPRARLHDEAIVSVEVARDGRRVLTASLDGTAVLWDRETGALLRRFAHGARVRHARFTADGERAITACEDGTARIWSCTTEAAPLVISAHDGAVTDALPLDGARVLTIGNDGRAHVWNARDGELLFDLRAHDDACLCAVVDAQRGLIATGGADRRVLVSDAKTGALLRDLPTYAGTRAPVQNIEGNASALAFDSVRGRLVAAHRTNEELAMVWSLDDWKAQRVLGDAGGRGWSAHLAVDPRARWYVVAHSGVGDWTFLDAEGLRAHSVARHELPSAIVSALSFAPDGELLLVAARDGSVGLWDLAAGECHLQLRGEHGAVRAAAFSTDGEWLAVGSQDGTLQLWPVHPLPVARAYFARLTGRDAGR